MKKSILLGLSVLILLGSGAVWADNATPVPTKASAVRAVGTSISNPTPIKRKRKKKASGVATPAAAATVSATPAPLASKATQASISDSNALLTAGDQAYAAKDYAKAITSYSDYIKAKGKSPETEKKLLVAKFYQGMALEDEARKGLKAEDNYIKSDEESHNLMTYGKRQPSRGAHLVTLSLAFLTPQLAGGDIGFTFLSHWNVGLGIGFMGVDPRIKYYFDGDNASFFLGAGFATYNFNLNGNLNVGGGNGSFSGTLSGTFFHFTLGPSFQDKNGMFMEIPFDFGIANFTGTGNANGSTSVGGGGGGSTTVNGGGSGSGSYNGPFGILGFRVGYSI